MITSFVSSLLPAQRTPFINYSAAAAPLTGKVALWTDGEDNVIYINQSKMFSEDYCSLDYFDSCPGTAAQAHPCRLLQGRFNRTRRPACLCNTSICSVPSTGPRCRHKKARRRSADRSRWDLLTPAGEDRNLPQTKFGETKTLKLVC